MNTRLVFIALAAALACGTSAPSSDAGPVANQGPPDKIDSGTTDPETADAGMADAGGTDSGTSDAGPVDGTASVIPPFPGAQATLIVEGPVTELLVAPDGEHVLFVKVQRYTNCRQPLGRSAPLWLADTRGGTPTMVGSATTRYSFSAAGSRFALIGGDCQPYGTLVSYRADGTGATAVRQAAGFAYSGETLYSEGVRLALSDSAPVQLGPSLLSSDPLGEAAYSCDSASQRCLYFPVATDPGSAVPLAASRAGTAQWTPDGAWMVLADIAVSRDGREQQRVGGGCMKNERLTPDGKAVVYARLPLGPGCDGALVVHPLDASPEAQTGALPARLEGADYTWDWALSADGTQLLVSYGSIDSYTNGVLVASAKGGPFKDLLPEFHVQYAIAPDGSVYALEGAWPGFSLVHRSPGLPPETVMSGTDCLPVAARSGSGSLLVLEEDSSRVAPRRLHLLADGAAWPGVVLPGPVACNSHGYDMPFEFGFAGKTPVYLTRHGYDTDLVAVSDRGVSGVLAAGIRMFRVVGSTVYVVRAGDRGLWRIEVPQPTR